MKLGGAVAFSDEATSTPCGSPQGCTINEFNRFTGTSIRLCEVYCRYAPTCSGFVHSATDPSNGNCTLFERVVSEGGATQVSYICPRTPQFVVAFVLKDAALEIAALVLELSTLLNVSSSSIHVTDASSKAYAVNVDAATVEQADLLFDQMNSSLTIAGTMLGVPLQVLAIETRPQVTPRASDYFDSTGIGLDVLADAPWVIACFVLLCLLFLCLIGVISTYVLRNRRLTLDEIGIELKDEAKDSDDLACNTDSVCGAHPEAPMAAANKHPSRKERAKKANTAGRKALLRSVSGGGSKIQPLDNQTNGTVAATLESSKKDADDVHDVDVDLGDGPRYV